MEEQGLIVVKDSFLARVTNGLKRFFFKGKIKNLVVEDEFSGIKYISNNYDFVQPEILNARSAYRKYVINNKKGVAKDVVLYVDQKIKENEDKIRKLISINEDNISYEDILNLLDNEKKNIHKYKTRNMNTGYYNVPIGVIGVECRDARDSIWSMFKAISTRNAIIVLHDNYSQYSTESLILLILKECFKNFHIDDNIVQMYEKEEIDLKRLDKLITRKGTKNKSVENTIYLYQENDAFSEEVQKEVKRLKNTAMYKSYEIEPIRGNFANIVNYLSDKKASAVCMYTNNTQRAYKFINWIDCSNVFINTGIKNCQEAEEDNSKFFNSRYILHEDVF